MSKPAKPVTKGPLLPFEQHLRDHIAHVKETDPTKGASISVSVTLSFPKYEGDVLLSADYRRNQAAKARKPRGILTAIIGDLAGRKDALGDFLPARVLWPEFIGELDLRGLDPIESQHPTHPKRSTVDYDTDSGRKQITYGRFEATLSTTRAKNKLR